MKHNYINGSFVASEHGRENVNPSDVSDVLDLYGQADASQASEAVSAARRAFKTWGVSSPALRAGILQQIGTEIQSRKEELGRLLSREEGKTLAEGIAEAARAAQIFHFFAAEAIRIRGDRLASVRSGVDVEVTREPVGLVAIITPWNFPLAIPAWKIAPALAFGNVVLFKPADLVPGSAWALTEIISRTAIPPGVFNLVMGRGSVVGRALVEHADVDAISFTGSVETGGGLLASAAGRLAKVQLEMGGKNPLVILGDADLDTAVDCALQGAYFSTGQRCTATSRFIVQKSIYSRFVQALRTRMERLRVGDALAAGTDIGPVVDANQLDQDLRYVAIGVSEGARLLSGGQRVSRATEGFFFSPTLFVDAHNAMRISREEIFGPVACAIPVDSYEEALAIANDTEFGLTAGICTASLKHAVHFKRHAEAGMVMVNLPTAGVDYHVPFGGRKRSSYGPREQGTYAAEFYTTVKTAYTAA